MDLNLAVLAIFLAAGFLFVFVNLVIVSPLLRPGRMPEPMKQVPYECGMEPIGSATIRFNPRFFLIAVVFVLFDVELAFLFPWAVAYHGLEGNSALWALADLALFLLILLAGYAWAWRRGDLRWILPQDVAQ